MNISETDTIIIAAPKTFEIFEYFLEPFAKFLAYEIHNWVMQGFIDCRFFKEIPLFRFPFENFIPLIRFETILRLFLNIKILLAQNFQIYVYLIYFWQNYSPFDKKREKHTVFKFNHRLFLSHKFWNWFLTAKSWVDFWLLIEKFVFSEPS